MPTPRWKTSGVRSMAADRSTDILVGLSVHKDDLPFKRLVEAMTLEIDEDHRALETATDIRAINLLQGRIYLAKSIIKSITNPRLRKEK